MLVWEFLTKS